MTIIWYMIPEIWSTTDIIFCHFGPFFAYYPTNNPKNQNFEKMKKISWDIIILHKCSKNHDYMLYCSWDMAHSGCNCYFSFWAIFWLFTSLTSQKIKVKKNEKSSWRYHFTQVYQKSWTYAILFLRYGVWQM